ncbi:MAG: hypothetical protein K0S86_2763 [Geminicoccaceae bacterium]|nr:hypothetical protein [Geminicoccaceae bacterium]
MLDSNARRAPGYWLQLFLATGIATLGLALGSTAVVIGGMLVSPLMGPIVELGMGFAVGSSLLVIRSFLRVFLSAVGVVASAALITLALPFHEVTAEIAARTSPTLLDLLIAVFCALAAAYTTVRQTADTTAAAAGTAIGIALVPPLCVVGYGLGTAAGATASGAALLFTANFSAIVLFAVLSFLALGYNQVGAASLEHDYLETPSTRTDRAAGRAHIALRSVFGSRYGMAMRLVVPAVVLATVAVPLSRALDEVAWEVRVRDAIRRMLADESPRAVQSALTVERNTVALRLLIVGSPEHAVRLQEKLAVGIASVAGVPPSVSVTAVPDVDVLNATLATESRAAAPATVRVDLAEAERQVAAALAAAWPASSAGPLLGWSLELSAGRIPHVIVRHLGIPLGTPAEEMLARSLAGPLRMSVRVLDVALPPTLVAATPSDTAWLSRALYVLGEIARVDSVRACVTRPMRLPRDRRRIGPALPVSDAIDSVLLRSDAGRVGRVMISDGVGWSLRVAGSACVSPDSSQS